MEKIDIGLLLRIVAEERALDPDLSGRILQTILSRLRPPDLPLAQKTPTETAN